MTDPETVSELENSTRNIVLYRCRQTMPSSFELFLLTSSLETLKLWSFGVLPSVITLYSYP